MTAFNIATTTEVRTFPRGTVAGPYRFTVQQVVGEGTVIVFGPIETDVPPVSFNADLPPGDYLGVLVRNEVSASGAFTVPIVAGVDIEVPVSVTITLA